MCIYICACRDLCINVYRGPEGGDDPILIMLSLFVGVIQWFNGVIVNWTKIQDESRKINCHKSRSVST